ncbi:MAG: membrane integrity-associated transporter subunit PqiC [Gemmatimonadota bacterium]|nr:MAG: membrane integrity-associated transporter subunit PqiC [Gemmatimonadota bacterium]
MTRSSILLMLIGFGFSAALGGCSVLSPQADPTRFFLLTSLAEESAEETGDPLPGITLGLGPVSVAPYLKRNALVTRLGPNQVDFSEVDRWAEPIDAHIALILARDLEVLLGTEEVILYPWYSTRRPDYALELRVLRFERDAGGTAELVASWAVRDVEQDETLLERGMSFRESAAANTTEASVAALSRTVASLAGELAADLRGLIRR